MIAKRQVDVPTLDMTTISAGGGSIAWVDEADFLNIGHQSAGGVTGSACYDRGGTRATVTDADLIYGYINPEYFLGTCLKPKEGFYRDTESICSCSGTGTFKCHS